MNDIFFIRFLVTSLISSIIMLLILIVKRGLKNHISMRWQYNMGLLFLVLLSVPFIPANLMNYINRDNWFQALSIRPTAAGAETAAQAAQTSNAANWLEDFTMSADRTFSGSVIPFIMGVWITGIVAFIMITLFCNRKLRLIKESVKSAEDDALAGLFSRCKDELGLKNNIFLGRSILVKSPMTIGFFNMYIILPAKIWKTSSVDEVRYILLHELIHCKNKDIQVNNMMCFLQIIYWFNPLVHLAFKEIRLDREIACDSSVLKRLPEQYHIDYGKTLLKFASELSRHSAFSFVTDLGGTKRQIKKRIESIASFRAETRSLKVKSVCAFAVTGLLILSRVPAISTLAFYDDGKYSFQADNVKYEDLSSYFDSFDGSFVLYDMEADLYTIYNQEMSATRVSPASTYKIYSALIALQTGVISAQDSEREWDGKTYPYDSWNKDQDLTSAMQNSVSWYFQNIDAQAGVEELESYFTQLSYGNHDISGGIADYWRESTLRISPLEQVELLKDFYKNDTLFKPEYVNTLKEIMRLSEKDGAVLSGKTGTGAVKDKTVNGWFVGYVENNGHTYIFATNIHSEDNAGGSAAVEITLSILGDKGVY